MGSRKTGTARVEPPDTTWGTARVWGPVPGRRARRGVDARSLDSSCLSGLLEVAGAWGAGAGRGFGFGAGVGAGAGSGADGRLAPRSGVGAGCGGLM